jgi:hypothetical protein
MNLHYTSRFVKRNGKLYNLETRDNKAYELFVKTLEEGAVVDMYMSVEKDDGTLAQLAKIHAMCRTLASHCGETFEDMKLYVKDKAGLIIKDNSQMVIKSFGACSKEELSMAIQAAQEIGQAVNCLVD